MMKENIYDMLQDVAMDIEYYTLKVRDSNQCMGSFNKGTRNCGKSLLFLLLMFHLLVTQDVMGENDVSGQ